MATLRQEQIRVAGLAKWGARGARCGAVLVFYLGAVVQVRTPVAAKASNEMACRGGVRV